MKNVLVLGKPAKKKTVDIMNLAQKEGGCLT